MKIYLESATKRIVEVDQTTRLIFCKDGENPAYQGIEVMINKTVDDNKIYISAHQTLRITPRATNVCLIHQERD
jgi:hypothetical protein